MNDKLIELLEKLSGKLGTTVEHLYWVLIRQAKLDAIITIIQTAFALLCIIPDAMLWHWIVPYCVAPNPKGTYHYETDWPAEVQLGVGMLAVASLVLLGWI